MCSKRLSTELKGPLGPRNNERDVEARLQCRFSALRRPGAVAHRLSERPGEGENGAGFRKGLGVNRNFSGFHNLSPTAFSGSG